MIDPIWDWGGRVGPIRQTIARQSDTVLQLLISKLFVACSQSQAEQGRDQPQERVFIIAWSVIKTRDIDWRHGASAPVPLPPCLRVVTLLHLYETPKCLAPLS